MNFGYFGYDVLLFRKHSRPCGILFLSFISLIWYWANKSFNAYILFHVATIRTSITHTFPNLGQHSSCLLLVAESETWTRAGNASAAWDWTRYRWKIHNIAPHKAADSFLHHLNFLLPFTRWITCAVYVYSRAEIYYALFHHNASYIKQRTDVSNRTAGSLRLSYFKLQGFS